MATATARLVSAEEFFDFVNRPENRDRVFELEAGEIVELPRLGIEHEEICGNLALIFNNYVSQRKGGRVLASRVGLVLARIPGTVQSPDLSIYTNHKEYAESFRPGDSSIMPTLVAEVVAPHDKFHRLTKKLNRFLDKGVELVWIVEPETRMVIVWWEGHAPITFDDGEAIANLPALPYFHCKVSEIFDKPAPRADIAMVFRIQD